MVHAELWFLVALTNILFAHIHQAYDSSINLPSDISYCLHLLGMSRSVEVI